MVRIGLIAAILLTLGASSSIAHEHQHGSGEKLGLVHFATSCNEAAQKEFNRAVALLHSFQFGGAIEGFNAVLGKDATCGIAYWGISLSDWSNPFAPGIKDKGQLQLGRESAERGKNAGVKTERSYVVANKYLETTAPRIWACGDVHGKLQFTHAAAYEAVKLVRS